MTNTLILVPTKYELNYLRPLLADIVQDAGGVFALCGFGAIASGIRATQLLAQHQPESVILVGIAGSLNSQPGIGTASVFSHIGCYGIGAGSGSNFCTADELGWAQLSDPDSGHSFIDVIHVGNTPDAPNPEAPMLLTVCAASASADDVADRVRKYPRAVAEDMEAFSVAMACRMADIPLTVIRGISNIAGDRDKAHWNVRAALEAAAELTASRIQQ